MKNLIIALLITSTLIGCKQNRDVKHPMPLPVVVYTPTVYDSLVMHYVNVERLNVRPIIPLLEINTELGNVCATHSLYMVQKGKPSHDFFTARAELFPGRFPGEVVAYNYHEPKSVVSAWMNSKGHHDIILNPDFTEFACSHHTNSAGKIYVEMMLLKTKQFPTP